MKYLMIVLVALMLVSCVPPKVTLAHDLCVRYEVSWKAEKAIPPQTICVCEEDVFPGLVASLNAIVSFPDFIDITGAPKKGECEVKDKTANVPEEVNGVLTN